MSTPRRPRPAGHLIALHGGSFELWKDAVLRASGFPFDELECCVAQQTCAAIDASNLPLHTLLRSQELQSIFIADQDRTDAGLVAVASDEHFRSALCWQNRAVLAGPIRSLLTGRMKARRQRLRTVASYLQRYCAKNDTIGFFGPSAWISLGSAETSIDYRPGTRLIRSSSMSFEHWSIQAIADRLSTDPQLREQLAPRLLPWASVVEDRLRVATMGSFPMPEEQLRFLAACNGIDSAADLIATFCQETGSERGEWLGLLERSLAMDILTWKLEVPMLYQPEAQLEAMIARLPDSPAKARASQLVRTLLDARDQVDEAEGADALFEKMGALETTFREFAATEATRSSGRTYGARTILTEDCARDCELAIGEAPLHALASPLNLILRSASWFTREVARGYRKRMRELFDAQRVGNGDVELASLQKALLEEEPDQRTDAPAPAMRTATKALQEKWAQLLDIDPSREEQHFKSHELEEKFDELFPGSGPGWDQAIYFSPDLMISSASLQDIEDGHFHWILNEVHLLNSLAIESFLCHHTDRTRLQKNMAADYGQPVVTLDLDNASVRYCNPLRSTSDIRVLYDARPPAPQGPICEPIGEFFAREIDGELRVVSADGRHNFDPLTVISDLLCDVASRDFAILSKSAHRPRVLIDKLVISRRSWSIPASQLAWSNVGDSFARFVSAYAWWRESGLPRRTFAKASWELKPIFVDWKSPILLEFLVRLIGSAPDSDSCISFTEMLPDSNQLWLHDHEDRRYTSELRVVTVDRADRDQRRAEPNQEPKRQA